MSTLITAPDGAIFALLAVARREPAIPNEDAEAWLREQSLMHDTPGGVTELTSRGRAYLGMILATPLPEQVQEWRDPRGIAVSPVPAPPPPALDLASLGMAIAQGISLAMRPPGVATTAAALERGAVTQPAAVPPGAKPITIVKTIPPDYTEVPDAFKTIPPGQWPASLPPDGTVQVIYRDGRVSAPRAVQSIIWLHKDHVDDVMAYKYLGGDTITPVITAPTTGPA